MDLTKNWWQSRTIWANIVAGIFTLLVALKVVPVGLDQETVLNGIMGGVAVMNIVLRFFTKTAVTA